MSKEQHPVRIDLTQAAIERAEAQQSDALLLHRARVSRRARNRFVRRLADSLHAQLREIITQDTDKLLAVIQAGGAVRVGVEVALPDQVVAALSQAQPETEYGTDVPPKIELVMNAEARVQALSQSPAAEIEEALQAPTKIEIVR